MEKLLNEEFREVAAKKLYEEQLRRWRNFCLLVKNPNRRFRFSADLNRHAEAQALRHSNQPIRSEEFDDGVDTDDDIFNSPRGSEEFDDGVDTDDDIFNSQRSSEEFDDKVDTDEEIINSQRGSEELPVESDPIQDHHIIHLGTEYIISQRGSSEEVATEVHTDDYIISQRGSEEVAVEFHPMNLLLLTNSETNHTHTIQQARTDRFVSTLAEKTKYMICSVVFYKWFFRMFNIFIEILQAILTQESAQGKLHGHVYRKLIVITSSVCFFLSLVEIIEEAKQSRVVWRRNRGRCCWFYHPGRQDRLFGNFFLYFNVLSSAIQFFINLAVLIFNNNFIAFDYLSLLFAVSCLFTPVADYRNRQPNAELDSQTHLP